MHGHRLTLDHLCAPRLRVARAGRHDVHVMAARDESGGEALGEAGRAVDVGGEGVGADDDREPIGRWG